MSEVNIGSILLKGEKQDFILNKKNFKTGSRGYHATGKMQVGEKRYQINLYRFEEGRIAETWQLMDVAGFMRQIGALTT